MQQHDTDAIDNFDPARWLASWSAAGGGWAGRHLVYPPTKTPALRKLARQLGVDEIRALAQHMGIDTEVEV